MGRRGLRASSALFVSFAMLVSFVVPAVAHPPMPGSSGDNPTVVPGLEFPEELTGEDAEGQLFNFDAQYIATKTAGDSRLSIEQAGALRSAAANAARKLLKNAPPPGPAVYTGGWTSVGPDPINQIGRTTGNLITVTGRIGALAITPNGRIILGAAQGGVWTLDADGDHWVNRTDNLPSLATGAIAVAPSNGNIVYDGTGEGALSGDSYFGNGILKSTDGGNTWTHVSGDYFLGVSIARLAVDQTDPSHLYAAVLRGRGGAHRVSPPLHSAYGIWESKDGGVSWTLLKPAPTVSLGATDIRIDPQNKNVIYASFWSDKIYKSADGGATWNPIMNGLPTDADYAAGLTRFNLAVSHPAGAAHATIYTGFDYVDNAGDQHVARVWKSVDDGASWAITNAGSGLDKVEDYCGTQCFYDNVIEVAPDDPNVVFAGGNFGYNMVPPSGGIFRSDDGGATWRNLGADQHPDFHALAFDPTNSQNVVVGNDGGVWYSTDRGGRQSASSDLTDNTWQDFNCCGLVISQFTSIQTNPSFPAPAGARLWYGAQDNGTGRKSAASNQWFDLYSGDGGMVQVDPTDWHYVYGTYFAPPTQVYRSVDGGGFFASNQFIRTGINLGDRAEFYEPLTLNKNNTNQLFIGTFRLYRTDNAKDPSASQVRWNIISPDLTSGCTGPAPNGARNCTLSAIGVGGGTAVYTGAQDGYVYFSPNAQSSLNPTWIRRDAHSFGLNDKHTLPNRPVSSIAVDRSNYRIAYFAYNGFSASTPHQPGHVYKTTDAGASFTDISGNLPDSPVNWILIDPSFSNTLYAGTDVGPMVSYNGGAVWQALGTGFPTVAVDQIDIDPTNGILAAASHGRGGWRMTTSQHNPALVISKTDSGAIVGAGSNVDYTIHVQNIGNGAATGVKITDPIPANTTFVSADHGGTNVNGVATWTGQTVAAGTTLDVHLTVRISPTLKSTVKSIVNDGFKAVSAQGPSASGSPYSVAIAPAYSVSVTPATQQDGAKPGNTVTYHVTLHNNGINADTYTMSAASGFPVTFFDSTCTTLLTTTATVPSAGSLDVCVKVAIPSNGTGTNDATITATSVGNPAASASSHVLTIAVTVDTLYVDQDANNPDTHNYYTTALNDAHVPFIYWDLDADHNITQSFMNSFKNIVWATGTSYPGPIGPYESRLKNFLDGGGRLFLSGEDLLDQAGGQTSFVHDYLHVAWDGTENQNDKGTDFVDGVSGTLTDGLSDVPIDHDVLANEFEDQITPNGGATGVFTDETGAFDGLSFTGSYKVVFIAFPFEEYGSAAQKADLITRVMTYFG